MLRRDAASIAVIVVGSLFVLSAVADAQPVLVSVDFPQIGEYRLMHHSAGEPLPVSAFTMEGSPQVWDFTVVSAADLTGVSRIDYETPAASGLGGDALFPAAEFATRFQSLGSGASPTWRFFAYSASGRVEYGRLDPADEFPVSELDPPVLDHPLPMSLGSSWIEEFSAGEFLVSHFHRESSADAWGTAVLPELGVIDCLRVARLITQEDFVDDGSGTLIPIGSFTYRTYTWIGSGVGELATIVSDLVEGGEPPRNFAEAISLSMTVEAGVAPPLSFARGDVTGDGLHDLADPIQTISFLFEGMPLDCPAVADANGDGLLDCSDAIYLLTHMFTLGPPPPAPYPNCGVVGSTPLACVFSSECP
ncbi:MAG: hypothetical protein ACKVX7_10725 [Planctomycetota bacterium]